MTLFVAWLAACGSGVAGTPLELRPEFNDWWYDGNAELSGYSLVVDRYGHRFEGRASMIYVTEPIGKTTHVKVNDASVHGTNVVTVMKLNFNRHFQTGIYDYTTMGSTFASLTDLSLLKSAFSSTEWCGMVYEQLDVHDRKLKWSFASYFEGESSAGSERVPAGGIMEDELFVRLRGFGGEYLAEGESVTVPFLASPFYRRLAHTGLAWSTATIQRGPNESVTVGEGAAAADSVAAMRYEVGVEDGRKGVFHVEAAWPNRVLSWSWSGGGKASAGGNDEGRLLATARLPYWQLHNPGDESNLKKLGLPVPNLPGANATTTPSLPEPPAAPVP